MGCPWAGQAQPLQDVFGCGSAALRYSFALQFTLFFGVSAMKHAPMGIGTAQGGQAAVPIEDLCQRAGAERYGISLGEFGAILRQVASRYGRPAFNSRRTSLTDSEVADFWLERQRFLPDLALATGCARGSNAAWEEFIARFRPQLHRTALALTHEESSARELAESVYSELYGLPKADGHRVSKLDYYAGLGSLDGWLKAVLAQEYTNQRRRWKREVSLEEEDKKGTPLRERLPAPEPAAGTEPLLVASVDKVLSQVQASQRFILTCYFLEGWTLAQIAQAVRVHESTISRRLERTILELRDLILTDLQRQGLSSGEASEALQADVRDLAVDVRARLKPAGPQDEQG